MYTDSNLRCQFQFAHNDNKHIAIRNSLRTEVMLNMRKRCMFIMIWHILLNQRYALNLPDFGECDMFIMNFTCRTKCIALSVLWKLLVCSKLRYKYKKKN